MLAVLKSFPLLPTANRRPRVRGEHSGFKVRVARAFHGGCSVASVKHISDRMRERRPNVKLDLILLGVEEVKPPIHDPPPYSRLPPHDRPPLDKC
jgi:hypothetical protein